MKATQPILSVQAANRLIKDLIEKNPTTKDVWIRGELSNFTHHGSGHMYFSLKDAGGVLKVVMFKQQNQTLPFIPKNGMKVIVRGAIVVYEKGGTVQIQAKDLTPDGVGSLHLAYEQLKERLEQEGLFSPAHKKPIPHFPKTIGVITSPTGAAVRDILITTRRRYPLAKIIFMPVLVQGEQAAASIVGAIEKMTQHNQADVLIVGRGGGSIEDLWAFNEEPVARAIFHCPIPTISAVGHETDVTICDFVADVRAATPTAAAEIATRYTLEDLQTTLFQLQEAMRSSLVTRLAQTKTQVETLEKMLAYAHPAKKVQTEIQALDQLTLRLTQTLETVLRSRQNELALLSQKLHTQSPTTRIEQTKQHLSHMDEFLFAHMTRFMAKKQEALGIHVAKLDQLSPLKTLARGYTVTEKDGQIIRTVQQVTAGDQLTIRYTDGTATCTIQQTEGIK